MGKFRYTVDNCGCLTEEQRQFYEDNGYIVFKNFSDHAYLDAAKQRFLDIVDGRVKKGFMVILKDLSLCNKNGEAAVTKVQDWLYDDVLYEFINNRCLLNIIESFTGPNITAIHSMLINKPPNGDPQYSNHHIHQDLHFFPIRPADRIVGLATAIDPMTPENGCLYVVPGSHKQDLYPHTYPEGFRFKLYHAIYKLNPDEMVKTYVRLEKGDMIMFHPLLLHGSGPNLSDTYRKLIVLHFADSNVKYTKPEGTQAKLKDEIEALFQGRGIRMDVADLWKGKARLVQGHIGEYISYRNHL